MNSRLAAASLLAALCCAPVLAQEEPITPSGTRRTGLANRAPADYLSERQAYGFFEAVDTHETEAAQLALERSKNDEVLDYARQTIADHEDFKRKLGETGVSAAGSEERRRMEERSRMTNARLRKLEGGAFDRAYIAAQIEDHEKILDKVDKKIAPHAKTGAFASHVQDRRPVFEAHLEHARRIKARLGTR